MLHRVRRGRVLPTHPRVGDRDHDGHPAGPRRARDGGVDPCSPRPSDPRRACPPTSFLGFHQHLLHFRATWTQRPGRPQEPAGGTSKASPRARRQHGSAHGAVSSALLFHDLAGPKSNGVGGRPDHHFQPGTGLIDRGDKSLSHDRQRRLRRRQPALSPVQLPTQPGDLGLFRRRLRDPLTRVLAGPDAGVAELAPLCLSHQPCSCRLLLRWRGDA